MKREKGYGWGIASLIIAITNLASPILMVMLGLLISNMPLIEPLFQVLFVSLAPIGFIVAFLGKVRTISGTRARKFCNFCAGVGLVICAIFGGALIGVFWLDVMHVGRYAAMVTAWVDTILIIGYWLIAYICGEVIWFV